MKLTLKERGILSNVIPTNGRYSNLKEYRKLKELLIYTEDESKEFNIIYSPDGMVRWDVGKALTYLKDIAMTEAVTTDIQVILMEKEKKGELLENELTLYEKFVVFYNNLEQ